MKKSVVKEILSTSVYLLCVLIATYLIIHYIGQRTEVQGSSMEPTLQDGDNLIVDKISYRLHDPQRFDIIVFPFQYEEETYYIKRIIGMPGETVRIDWDGNIYINGEILQESYGREVIQNPGRAEEEILLGEDEYFVLGDNRNNSTDGRADLVGNIHREDIIGRAWVRIYPFEKAGKLRHQ
ncbi:MAG: signal peptidase I [Lachnospiraceae bacterium]|nr:signal peptidase I [Lachnospiraceae bacterium]